MASVTAKAKSTQASKAKKPSGAKVPRSHPPYVEMITEAIAALKERTGSSQYAIAKFIEEKQKAHLPPNFKKLLLVQLRKLVASEKLVKIKNSFKLGAVAKPASAATTGTAATKKAPAAAPVVKAPAKKKVAAKPKAKATAKAGVGAKPKGATPVKTKKVAPKPKAVSKPKKAAKTAAVTTPAKKKVATPAKKKRAPANAVKKPKSIKSPAKKAATKKGRK